MINNIKKIFYSDIGSGSEPVAAEARNTEATTGEYTWWDEHSKERFSYEFLVLRDLQKDTLLWQTPALALTAHAFLLTISLSSSSPRISVLVASFLGIVVSAMAMQLMAKHRFLSLLDRAMLDRLERKMELEPMTSKRHFFKDGEYAVPEQFNYYLPKKFRFATRVNSFFIWMTGLAIFGLINTGILAVDLLGLEVK